MVSGQELARIRARKDLLVTQCDLYRSILTVECQQLQSRVAWMERGSEWLHRARPWLPLIAPVAGFIVARRWKTVLRLARQTISWRALWRLARS